MTTTPRARASALLHLSRAHRPVILTAGRAGGMTATSPVGAWVAEVTQDFGVGAAGVEEGISEHGEAVRVEGAGGQDPVLVGVLGQPLHSASAPGEPAGVEGDGAEGVGEEIT